MQNPAEEFPYYSHKWQPQLNRNRIVVVSSDEKFAEWLRGQLAGEFDVLIARHAGEAVAKAKAAAVGIALIDVGAPLLGAPALAQIKSMIPAPVVCALAFPGASETLPQFDFDFILARPSSAEDMSDRLKFILAKIRSIAS